MWFATVSGECTRKASWPVGLGREDGGDDDAAGKEADILQDEGCDWRRGRRLKINWHSGVEARICRRIGWQQWQQWQ